MAILLSEIAKYFLFQLRASIHTLARFHEPLFLEVNPHNPKLVLVKDTLAES